MDEPSYRLGFTLFSKEYGIVSKQSTGVPGPIYCLYHNIHMDDSWVYSLFCIVLYNTEEEARKDGEYYSKSNACITKICKERQLVLSGKRENEKFRTCRVEISHCSKDFRAFPELMHYILPLCRGYYYSLYICDADPDATRSILECYVCSTSDPQDYIDKRPRVDYHGMTYIVDLFEIHIGVTDLNDVSE